MTTIRELITDMLPPIRVAAVEALVQTNQGESPSLLRARFPQEKDPKVKRAIILAMGKLADREALDLLTATLRDPRAAEPIRDAALEAVEMIGSKKAVDALTELLARRQLSLERQPRVIAALGRFKDAAAIKPLTESLKSEAPAVRAAAIDAMVAIVKDKSEPERQGVSRAVRRSVDRSRGRCPQECDRRGGRSRRSSRRSRP